MKLDKYWDDIHLKYNSGYDGWLDNYLNLFHKQDIIVELGCGRAYDSRYLQKLGFQDIIACDFSKEVLSIIKEEVPNLKTLLFDMKDGLPFEDNSINIFIANLSIHYFDAKTTSFLANEIYRALKNGGIFIARVNSTHDTMHMPKTEEIEEDFFYNGDIYKRFFNEKSIRNFFHKFEFYHIEEKSIGRYEKNKVLWEFCIIKK